MTLNELLKLPGLPTISKYEIAQRADTLYGMGRYYGGQINPAELRVLTDHVEMSLEAKERILDEVL